jgi:hypothetical protein
MAAARGKNAHERPLQAARAAEADDVGLEAS